MDKTRKKLFSTRSGKRKAYVTCMLALPLLQFLIFWVYSHFNSFLLAFQNYETNYSGLGYDITFAGLDNFKYAWNVLFSSMSGEMVKNSLLLYLCNLVIVTFFALAFSYYIAKQRFCSGAFRILLYLPHIVSSLVLAVLYSYLVTSVYQLISESMTGVRPLGGLLDNPETQYGAVLFFNLWYGFGLNVVLYTNAMTGVNASLVEAAEMDGANLIQEFIYIYFPNIYSTFTVFIVTGFAGIFTNQMQLLAFFGVTGKNFFNVFGFYLYTESLNAPLSAPVGNTMGTISALGLLLTAIVAPISLVTRKLMGKYGPSAD